MTRRTRTPGGLTLALSLAALWSPAAQAELQPWPFDFDPAIAADPAAIESDLDELGAGLPGLREEELTEVTLGPVSLFFFDGLTDDLGRAVSSGPGVMPALSRRPVLCAAHEAFTFPSNLLASSTLDCRIAETALDSALSGGAAACTEVEYPEVYVFDHPPGQVNNSVVRSLEGLIAVSGEALSHIEYPAGLLPSDFFTALRPIIAKIRYDTLVEQLETRRAAYDEAIDELSSSADCFEPGPRASLEEAVSDLIEELDEARAHLDGIYEEGLARAEADRAEARADCRARPDLPYPALTDDERILLAHYLGGIFWRARGAGLLAYPPDPEMGLLRRMLYVGEAFQTLANLAGGEGGRGVGTNLLIDENWGWDEWWDMGTNPGSADKYSDLVGMTKRGKRGSSLTRPLLEGRGYDVRSFVGGAMMMGPCYYFAWEELADFRLGEDLQDPYMWFIEWPTSIGEYCAGAALAEGLARTLLWGTPIPPEECAEPICPEGDCDGGGPDGGAPDGGAPDGGESDSGPDGGAPDSDVIADGDAVPCGPCPEGQACDSEGRCAPVDSDAADPDRPDSGCGCSAASMGGGEGSWAIVIRSLLREL